MNSYFPHIYCINLLRRTDRFTRMANEFLKHNIHVNYHVAVDGRDIKKQYPMSPGVCGCAFSHFEIIQRAKLMGLPYVFIFEDDVELHPDFECEIHCAMNAMPTDWDLIYFSGTHLEPPTQINDRIYKATKTVALHAYAIKETVYDRILALIPNMEQPVDGYLADLQKEFNAYIVKPSLAWQRPDYSDIENTDVDYSYLKNNL